MKQITPARFSVAMIGLLLANLASAQPQLSGTPEELREFLYPRPNTVNISGEGELTAYKDVAKVSLLVTTQARNLNTAMSLNQELRQELIEQFIAAGVPETEINNSNFSSAPQYGLFGRNPSSYEVIARLDVSVGSESHLQLLATAADENDEVEFEAIEFEHSAEEDFERQVRDLALADVMEQRSFYEANLGVTLQPINFFYGGIHQLARTMPATAMMRGETAAVSSFSAADAAMAEGSAPATSPSFDEVEYRTSLTVVFEIVSENQN